MKTRCIVLYADGDWEFLSVEKETEISRRALAMAKEHFWFEHENEISSLYSVFIESVRK